LEGAVKDDFGDRMKMYESVEAQRHLMPLLPVLARIDGRTFSAFTKGMKRPFDPILTSCMVDTTIELVRETNACMGYTQSDEITLAWYSDNVKSQIWFDGRIQKMVSQLGAQATLIFYRLIVERLPDYANRLPTFDARVWNVPNLTEGANVFLWREWDATKNSVSMAASAYYSHKQLVGKNSVDKHQLLFAKDINWNDYPASFKRGVYVQRRTESIAFSADELERLPPKHEARLNPGLLVERAVVKVLDMPQLATVINRSEVIFGGEEPKLRNSATPSPETE
jgi:tRNA(His) guanylyltransferase